MSERIEILRRIERQYLRDQLGELELQMVDAYVLRLLARHPGALRQEDIAQWIVLDKGSVARSLARLEKRGLVARTVSDQCRREKQVLLTPAGADADIRISQILNTWNEIRYHGFTEDERALYESFLDRITQNVTQYRQGGKHNGQESH